VNLLLLEPGELRADGTARVGGRRARHVEEVLGLSPGDALQAGVVGGRMGTARVLSVGPDELVLAPVLDVDPPPPSPVSLLLALPRPKILRKVLAAVASMGVKRLVLVGSFKVEKSYWSSPLLAATGLRTELVAGLEQGRDTVLPEVTARRLFKPFLEDELDVLLPEPVRLLAHPTEAEPLDALFRGGSPRHPLTPSPSPLAPSLSKGNPPGDAAEPARDERRAALAIGPEGGWTEYEAARLREKGFRPFSLGARVLRVDTAVPYAIAQAELWLRSQAPGPGLQAPAEAP
jgi:16S rRNA (uracil1498-N3)-methyltransferase